MPSVETGKLISSAVIVRDGRALVFEEKNDAGDMKFNLPGGHVEPGETPIEAMLREVREETGLACEPRAFLQLVVNTWSRNHSVLMVFLAEITEDAEMVLEEGISARWMTADEIAALPDDGCVFGTKNALLNALNGRTLPSSAFLMRKRGEQFDWGG